MKNTLTAQSIQVRTVGDLKPRHANPRTHSRKQLEQIASSIREFGFTVPILIDAKDVVIAGHGRLEAAKLLGMTEVPTICLDHMSEAQIRAYVIADNKLAENAGWDNDILAIEFEYLSELELDLDATVTGFETAEIDLLLDNDGGQGPDEADELPELDRRGSPVTLFGDLWLLGPHRLVCADATKQQSYQQLMADELAEVVFVDPPYNVPIDGHVCGLGAVKHREFAMGVGEMSEPEFTRFLQTAFEHLAAASIAGSIHFVCMDWRHLHEVTEAGRTIYGELKNLCVWNKTNAGMGALYRSKHELVFVFKSGTKPHINNVELGRYGRYRTNVWDYPGVNTLREGRREELAMHPTVKPVRMVADAIRDCSRRGAIVLDSFGGSGTTLLAAEKAGRRGYLMELDPVYVDVAIERWRKLTGGYVKHAESGLDFDAIKEQRACALDNAQSTQGGGQHEEVSHVR